MKLLTTFLLIFALLVVNTGTGNTTEHPDDTINVMTFNIRYGAANDGVNHWDYRQNLVVDTVEIYEPDIIGWQEMLDFQLDYMLDELEGYEYYGRGRETDASGEGCYIFYDPERFELLQDGTFWLTETPGIPGSVSWDSSMARICSWIRLFDLNTEKSFYVYNAHFDHIGVEARYESAALILERISMRSYHDPVILMGDLNCGESSEPIALLNENLIDTFRAVNPDAETVGTFSGFQGRKDGEKIDYVFADTGFEIINAGIAFDEFNGKTPSDHYPVWGELSFTPYY